MPLKSFYLLCEKVLWTYLQSIVMLLTVGGTLNINFTTELAIAALPAALTVVANGLPQTLGAIPYLLDLVYRVARTFVVTFIGFILAPAVFHLDSSIGRAAALAAGAAALAVVKGALAKAIGSPNDASTLAGPVVANAVPAG